MATPKWQPGKLYPPGSLVVPLTDPPSGVVTIVNPGFETGDATGWTLDSGASVSSSGRIYAGSYSVRFDGSTGITRVTSEEYPCAVGSPVTARCMYHQGAASSGRNVGKVFVAFLDSSHAMIGAYRYGNIVNSSSGGWRQSSVTTSAPSGTAFIVIGIEVNRDRNDDSQVDNFSWNLSNKPDLTLQYKAVQPATGYSDTVEPTWPGVLGQQVIDHEVIWEAVSLSRVVYEAQPILKSGAVEPVWPDTIGASVSDGTISWTAYDPRVKDENCPNTKVVCIAKFKVYAGAGDIVRYSATLDPTDWTSEKDAGYLGTGVQQNGANDVSVLNLYRADLVVMNATTFQRWQIDPNPELMDLLDTMDGIGSIYHLACVPVSNDLFYLANKGVRTVGVTGSTKNMAAGDVGMPVDDMVKAAVREMTQLNAGGAHEEPLGLYWPSSGQYWLSFNRIVPDDASATAPGGPIDLCPTLEAGDSYAEVMVYTVAQTGQVGAWSRYVFPFRIDDWTQEGDYLYVRDGNTVFRIGDDIGCCDRYIEGEGVSGDPFNAMIQWPWLDDGAPGADKQMESFEVVGYGRGRFEFGYDQTEPGYFTDPYEVVPDTLRGTPVPMPIVAPSYSVRVRYDGWNPVDDTGNKDWSLIAISMQFT